MALPDSPQSRGEEYLNNIATGSGDIPDVPQTRIEQYLNKIATGDGDIPDAPQTRVEQYLNYIAENGGGGGGGGEAVLINKSISSNGTYNASSDNADGYKKVTVSVPNSYAAGDEGKVVSNGALVSQTSQTVTENGTVDTTTINSVTVNVPTGGGGISATEVLKRDTFSTALLDDSWHIDEVVLPSTQTSDIEISHSLGTAPNEVIFLYKTLPTLDDNFKMVAAAGSYNPTTRAFVTGRGYIARRTDFDNLDSYSSEHPNRQWFPTIFMAAGKLPFGGTALAPTVSKVTLKYNSGYPWNAGTYILATK